jgi:hypothetical protein
MHRRKTVPVGPGSVRRIDGPRSRAVREAQLERPIRLSLGGFAVEIDLDGDKPQVRVIDAP